MKMGNNYPNVLSGTTGVVLGLTDKSQVQTGKWREAPGEGRQTTGGTTNTGSRMCWRVGAWKSKQNDCKERKQNKCVEGKHDQTRGKAGNSLAALQIPQITMKKSTQSTQIRNYRKTNI